MNRTAALASVVLLTSMSLYAETPRSRRNVVSSVNVAEGAGSENAVRPRRGKSVALIETLPSYTDKKFDAPDVTEWIPSAEKSIQVAALPSPVIYSIPDNLPAQKIESMSEVVEFGLPSIGSIPAGMVSSDFVLAKEKTLTPTLEDGLNDAAIFGPGAEEVTVKDVMGRRIFHARRRGVSTLRWDCRGPAGKFVEEGIYFALVLNQDGVEFRQSFMVIR